VLDHALFTDVKHLLVSEFCLEQ